MHTEIGEALIRVDLAKGAVLECTEAAIELLTGAEKPGSGELLEKSDAIGVAWHKLLGVDKSTRSALQQALVCKHPVQLPPFILARRRSEDIALSGLVLPAGDTAKLILWQVSGGHDSLSAIEPARGDCIAVMGADRLRISTQGGEQEASQFMSVLRQSLSSIVRPEDSVWDVMDTSVVIVLRETDMQGATDVCRAYLSHLHRILRDKDTRGFVARLRVGLSRMSSGRSFVSALLAADRAMLQARRSWNTQQVRAENAEDFGYLLKDAIQGGGVFSARAAGVQAETTPVAKASVANAFTGQVLQTQLPDINPMERDIDGYVTDNMEGAVDQAAFLGKLDAPVAIIGSAGTGKMYVARVFHEASGASDELLVQIDCRELRGRKQADAFISRELARGEGKTLVFKSPHLMNSDSQQKLARQIASRRLADSDPPRALTQMRFVALFPLSLERLIRRDELNESLASVFAGFPIHVPPIKDRKQAVLRWAHKILGQEGARRDRDMRGFTPDAEQAMLLYDWPGNISEMRQSIIDALDKTSKNWLTPVDLGLFDGIDPEGSSYVPESAPFLTQAQSDQSQEEGYTGSTLESLDVALGQAVKSMLAMEALKPLGSWLDDDLVLAVMERYRGSMPRSGSFLHTKPRNIGRWLPKITQREEERNNSALWLASRKLLREWVRESSQLDESPLLMLQEKLLRHIESQAAGMSAAKRAKILGVSTPTYLKRLKEVGDAGSLG